MLRLAGRRKLFLTQALPNPSPSPSPSPSPNPNPSPHPNPNPHQADTPKLFDVLPIRGLLLPGESQRAEILYKGGIDCKALALAL